MPEPEEEPYVRKTGRLFLYKFDQRITKDFGSLSALQEGCRLSCAAVQTGLNGYRHVASLSKKLMILLRTKYSCVTIESGNEFNKSVHLLRFFCRADSAVPPTARYLHAVSRVHECTGTDMSSALQRYPGQFLCMAMHELLADN